HKLPHQGAAFHQISCEVSSWNAGHDSSVTKMTPSIVNSKVHADSCRVHDSSVTKMTPSIVNSKVHADSCRVRHPPGVPRCLASGAIQVQACSAQACRAQACHT